MPSDRWRRGGYNRAVLTSGSGLRGIAGQVAQEGGHFSEGGHLCSEKWPSSGALRRRASRMEEHSANAEKAIASTRAIVGGVGIAPARA